jgi:DNA-binding transcriptional ArsR family regulator
MFQELDPMLHNQLRLQIAVLLVQVDWAEFNFLLEKTGATRGNLSANLSKLRDEGYIDMEKSFKGNYPLTRLRITDKGKAAVRGYVEAMERYLNNLKS